MTAAPLPRHAVDHRSSRPARISGIAGMPRALAGGARPSAPAITGARLRKWPVLHNDITAGHTHADGSAALSDIASAAGAPPRRTLRSGTKWLVTLARTVGQIRQISRPSRPVIRMSSRLRSKRKHGCDRRRSGKKASSLTLRDRGRRTCRPCPSVLDVAGGVVHAEITADRLI